MSEPPLQPEETTPSLGPPRKILFATDSSCRCDRALDRATSLCREWGARLIIVHGIESAYAASSVMPSWRQPLTPRQAALARLRADLRDVAGVQLELIAELAEPVPLILDTCDGLGAEVIVTGVARNEAFGRMLLGSTVDSLLAQAKVPILVVRSRVRHAYKNVVVATDFSPASLRALETAVCWLPQARITLFHAYRTMYEHHLDDPERAREAEADVSREQARAFLAASPRLTRATRDIQVLVEPGDVGLLLRDLVDARAVDLIVLGTRARRGLVRALLGSVAQRVLEMLQCDVLVVPPP